MTEEDKDKPAELSIDEMKAMLQSKEEIMRQLPRRIAVGGSIYRVKQVSKWIEARIHRLELEAYALSGTQKDAMPLKKAQRISRKLDRLHAKTAAYYLLGNCALFVPFAFWLTWRWLMLRDEEHCAMINDAGAGNKNINFSSANWDITKLRLALSMKPVGDGVRHTLKRWESAEQQAMDDIQKKAEESKSAASSPKAPTTKK